MYIISLLNENKKKKKKRTDISSRLEITQQPIILQSHCSDPLRAGCGTTIAVSFNILPDLSAALDTVDHSLLLARLSTRFGICDQALDWFRSYLSDRTQYVRIQDVFSDVHSLPYGVPQGFVLGPLLYSLYTSPLGDIARSHGLSYHFYADDTQLYLSFETSSPQDMSTCTSALEDC